MPSRCNVLLVAPRFTGRSFWNFTAACELYGARFPAPPLGLITVAALLPAAWDCRLVNRNTEELREADLDWADLVMTGGMLPQRPDALRVIELAQRHGKPVAVGGPDVSSAPEAYRTADFRVLGEAEGIIAEFIAAWEAGLRSGTFAAEKFTVDVSKTPIPRFDLLTPSHYTYFGIQFARGCPFKCEFCDIIELYGRVPRTKTPRQMLAEIERVYQLGYRGTLDFVDDNFIGNKKAVKAFLPHLIEWQRAHGYPFQFSTEASINLADDGELLGLMREANFFTVFVGIESPDGDTLVSMQKKQNTRRALADSVHRIYRAGMFVNAGFIVGFDSEKGSVAEAMIDCIEVAAIPFAMVGLLYALPTTQLTRRLAREGRLFAAADSVQMAVAAGAGDQCTAGLNFTTLRPRRDILMDYRTVLASIYRPEAYYGRVRRLMCVLDRRVLDRGGAEPERQPLSILLDDFRLLSRLIWRIATRQPTALWPFGKAFAATARANPRALGEFGILAAFYLHLGPFARFVIAAIDRQIAEIDAGRWAAPSIASPRPDLPAMAEPMAAE